MPHLPAVVAAHPVAAPDPETEPKTKIHEPMRNADGD